METKAVRLYGKSDLRLDSFNLREINDDEILAQVITDSICMSTYKAAIQGNTHKRVPEDIDQNPIIVGHEFSGKIVAVGKKWQDQFKPGQKFSIQPNINYLDKGYAPGYSFTDFGGDATYIVIPGIVMEKGCLLGYEGDAYFKASLAEPMSCIVAGYQAFYHIDKETYAHKMGVVEGGSMAILAGVGPMGLGALDYAMHCDRNPGRIVVTDINEERLENAKNIFTVEGAKAIGIELHYVNTGGMSMDEQVNQLLSINGGEGYDDVFVFAPVQPVVELGDRILGYDGCLNFFAGPTDKAFAANLNFYNVHYASTHIAGTSGGNTAHMIESLMLMGENKVNPAVMVTHIGGLNSVAETTLNLPKISGGKKLIYTNLELDLVAIADFEKLGKSDAMFKQLAEITKKHNGLWSAEAEKVLLEQAKQI